MTDQPLRVAMIQSSPDVGASVSNTATLIGEIREAAADGAALIVTPEVAVTGYLPRDLFDDDEFVAGVMVANRQIIEATVGLETVVVLGTVWLADGLEVCDPIDSRSRGLMNAAVVIEDGQVVDVFAKQTLPTYDVFDETRHFAVGAGRRPTVTVAGSQVGVLICEELWALDDPRSVAHQVCADKPDVVVVVNASPFERGKQHRRLELGVKAVRLADAPVVYTNLVGGQDHLAFDGASFALGRDGQIVAASMLCQPATTLFSLDLETPVSRPSKLDVPDPNAWWGGELGGLWAVLVMATGDYLARNGFSGVVLGLSGGIDSAVVATLAVDALGPENVVGLTMPSGFSSAGSVDDSYELAANLGMACQTVPIGALAGQVEQTMGPLFGTTVRDVTEENIQARLRGLLLMAFSNKQGVMLLSTSNRSETAVGYSTLYGDAAGGFAPLIDVPKTVVYALARWRNSQGGVIPVSTIVKAPSAELSEGQQDTDSLPDYGLLDSLLEAHIDEGLGVEALVSAGFGREIVERVVGLVARAEFKRRQGPPGPKVSPRMLTFGRQVPISCRVETGLGGSGRRAAGEAA